MKAASSTRKELSGKQNLTSACMNAELATTLRRAGKHARNLKPPLKLLALFRTYNIVWRFAILNKERQYKH